MFWNVKKTSLLNEEYEPRLHFLQNNYDSNKLVAENITVC